ncbi:DUF6428 family protein [Phycisphaeraceae bacterium D3-23]
MKLSNLVQTLQQHPDADLAFVLPDGKPVPPHFHVTEVGRVRKQFIDCGGTPRDTESCVLQVWVAQDDDHRLKAGKLGMIIGLAKDILRGDDLPLEVEYDVGVITQLAVSAIDASDGLIKLTLAGKHTACLAPDKCGVEGDAEGSGCCTPESAGAAGCCTPDPAVSLGGGQGKCC